MVRPKDEDLPEDTALGVYWTPPLRVFYQVIGPPTRPTRSTVGHVVGARHTKVPAFQQVDGCTERHGVPRARGEEYSMPIWVWIVIAAAVVVAAAVVIVALMTTRRKRTERLKERFGPEYVRTVTAAGGEPGVAEKELAARERQRDKLDIRALSPAARQGFAQRWRGVQSAFVDDPASALVQADQLVTEVMRERGYPVEDFDQRAADISVDHPTIVQNYRAAHDIHLSSQRGDVGTEQQRQAFVHYRALFDKLLEPETHKDPSQDTETAQE